MDTLKEHKRFLEQIDVCMSSDTMIFQRHLQAAPPTHTDLPPTPDRPNKRRIKHLANKQLGLGLRGSTHWQAQRLNKFLVAWWPPQGVPADIHSPLPLQIKVYICVYECAYI